MDSIVIKDEEVAVLILRCDCNWRFLNPGPYLLNVSAPRDIDNAMRISYRLPEYFDASKDLKIDPTIHSIKVNGHCQTGTDPEQIGEHSFQLQFFSIPMPLFSQHVKYWP